MAKRKKSDIGAWFSRAELLLMAEALDSYAYWQISDPSERRDGFVITHENPEIERCEKLEERLRALAAGARSEESEGQMTASKMCAACDGKGWVLVVSDDADAIHVLACDTCKRLGSNLEAVELARRESLTVLKAIGDPRGAISSEMAHRAGDAKAARAWALVRRVAARAPGPVYVGTCERCKGRGHILMLASYSAGADVSAPTSEPCVECAGTGGKTGPGEAVPIVLGPFATIADASIEGERYAKEHGMRDATIDLVNCVRAIEWKNPEGTW